MSASAKRSGLGRDFNSLFEDNMMNESTGGSVMLRLSDIEPNKLQPRKNFDEEALASLASSISEVGLLQPIIVTENIDYPGTYRIIAGERRWRASRMAGLTEVPCIVFGGDELTKAQVALVENIQRENLNPIEEAMGLRDLIERFGLTQEQCAEKTGRSRPAIANLLRLLDLPADVEEMVADGRLSGGHAKALLGLKDPDGISGLANKIIDAQMSVRDTEKAVKLLNKPVKAEKPVVRNVQEEVYFAELERRCIELSGHRIKILDGGEGKRKIMVDYSNNEDLEELLIKLCGTDILEK